MLELLKSNDEEMTTQVESLIDCFQIVLFSTYTIPRWITYDRVFHHISINNFMNELNATFKIYHMQTWIHQYTRGHICHTRMQKKLFELTNVQIVAEKMQKNESDSDCFFFYCIHFDGICMTGRAQHSEFAIFFAAKHFFINCYD